MPTKTTRPRKTAAAPPTSRPAPLVDLTADAFDPDAVEQRFLCELGGTEYHIPAQQPAGVLWQYIETERTDGADAAMWWLFGYLLGEDFVEAVRTYKGLTKAHLRALQMACIETITGPKG